MNITDQMTSAVDGVDLDLNHLTRVAQVRGTRLRRRRRAAVVTALGLAVVLGVATSVLVSRQAGPNEGAPSTSTYATSSAAPASLDVDFTAARRAPGQRLVASYLGPSRAVWDADTETAYVITRPWYSTTCPPASKAVLSGGGKLELTLTRETAGTPERECVADNQHLIAIVHDVDHAPTEVEITIETDPDAPADSVREPETIDFTDVVGDDWDPAPPPADIATSNFPRNSHGQTYGSSGMVLEYEDTPDLIATVADSGVIGFVLKTDMERDFPPGGIPVYDFEGEVVVGVFMSAGAGEVKAFCDGRPCGDSASVSPRSTTPGDS